MADGPITPTQDEERRLHLNGFAHVAGVDEVGRGPIAGPVVAAAVVLPDLEGFDHEDLHLIRDSKALTANQRERVLSLVHELALAVGVGEASNEEIDRDGIAPATRAAMRRALDQLSVTPDHLLLDAFMLDWRKKPCVAIIKGDAHCTAIAAAPIVAKVHRDLLLTELDARFPGYGLAGHKGYASAEHLAAVSELGPSPAHRRSFSPFKLTLFDMTAAELHA